MLWDRTKRHRYKYFNTEYLNENENNAKLKITNYAR